MIIFINPPQEDSIYNEQPDRAKVRNKCAQSLKRWSLTYYGKVAIKI